MISKSFDESGKLFLCPTFPGKLTSWMKNSTSLISQMNQEPSKYQFWAYLHFLLNVIVCIKVMKKVLVWNLLFSGDTIGSDKMVNVSKRMAEILWFLFQIRFWWLDKIFLDRTLVLLIGVTRANDRQSDVKESCNLSTCWPRSGLIGVRLCTL